MLKNKNLLKIIVVVLVIAIVFIVFNQLGLTEKLQNVRVMQQWFRSLGVLGYAVFILIYIVVAVFMLPASALTIIGGITFGAVVGGVLSIVGATLGATVAFMISKYFARSFIVTKFGEKPVFKKIENGVKKNGVSFLILTRLVPLFPYNIQNYAYGATSMNVFTFMLVSFATMLPGSFIYAYLAGEIAANGISIKVLLEFTAAGVILFAISLIPKFLAKKKGIDLEE